MKFRSWVKEFNNFMYWENGTYFFDEKIRVDLDDSYKKWFDCENAEQSTGKKDINNKDVFVGDIVKCKLPYSNLCLVVWDIKACGCYLKPLDGLGKAAYSKYYRLTNVRVEVIGNIHEAQKDEI